jgi:hypothetical protein
VNFQPGYPKQVYIAEQSKETGKVASLLLQAAIANVPFPNFFHMTPPFQFKPLTKNKIQTQNQ